MAKIKLDSKLTNMLALLKNIRKEIADREEAVKNLSKQERQLAGTEIPALFAQNGYSGIKLESGESVEIKESIKASCPKDSEAQEKVFAFLKEKQGEGLIKNILVIENPTPKIIKLLEGKTNFSIEKSVNTNSLQAFLSDLLGLKKGSIKQIDISEIPIEAHPFLYLDTVIKE